jgi:hypothetical protein
MVALADGRFKIQHLGLDKLVLEWDADTSKTTVKAIDILEVNDSISVTGFVNAQSATIATNLIVNGSLTANNISYNPWWVAGKVDGATLTILKNKGRYPFTVSRIIGIGAGAYNIEWTQAHPDGTSYIACCSGEGGGWNDLVNGTGTNITYNDKKMNVAFRKLYSQPTGANEGFVDCAFSFFIMA